MRKKRRLKGQAEAAEAIAREHAETPEIAEAIEGAELAREVVLEERAEARAALLATLAARPEGEALAADGELADAEAGEAGEALAAEGEPGEAAEAVAPAELSAERVASIVESLLFAAEKPLGVRELRSLLRIKDAARIEAAIETVRLRHESGHGIVLQEVAGGWQFRTASENSAWVQQLIAGRPVRLSRAQLETLAIIAYRQPITRPEIDEIRGVDSGSTLKVLMDRDLVRVLGKREEVGRPLIYGTTREFLEFFHLKDLRELPTLREFHELSEDSLREVEALDREDGREGGREGGGKRRGRAAATAEASFSGDDLAGDELGEGPAFAVIDASEQGDGPARAAEDLN